MHVVGVDLFCGAGGLTHGLKRTGIAVMAGVDIDIACKYPYEINNNAEFLHKSVSEISRADLLKYYPENAIKLLAGCAPCQPFSKYSQGRPRDERWGLLYHFSRLVNEIEPDLVTMENVPELIKHEVYLEFKSKLIDAGYFVADKVIYGPDYGMAQTRRRLVLIASKMGNIEIIPATHKPSEYLTVRDAIAHLPNLKAGQTHPDDPLHRAGGLTEINLKRIKASKPNGTWRDWPIELVAKCHLKVSGKGYSSVYGRMAWNEPSPTMTTQCYGFGNGRFGHPEQDRAISLREAAILQSFPDEYKFADRPENYNLTTLGRMIGNAVPVRLVEVVGLSIQKHLTEVNHFWPMI